MCECICLPGGQTGDDGNCLQCGWERLYAKARHDERREATPAECRECGLPMAGRLVGQGPGCCNVCGRIHGT